ncbi:hypothetical protein OM076_28915 [Solirubrobacter ginsenosidimutans]|uniref:Htaa domain-containing protein n=1 Tax=Solirubrobacter ginsenosidimutans TaxID=490573 RepID=A0A9X3S4D1_9ACTN|nr:hypothetical protein [Solirubrobacter ginsenosidimutans]MDA0164327.1 hypothetical protein [Solirubrobacter ginsenosidimutans]
MPDLRSFVIAFTTAAALAAAGAPAALADINFVAMPGYAGVELDDDAASRLELVRDGVVIASSDEGVISVDALEVGDVARAYAGDTPAGSATYDGTPVLSDVCVGSAAFTATRAPAAAFEFAGAFSDNALDPVTGTWDSNPTARITLDRPLADGDMAMVAVGNDRLDPPVFSMRMEPAVACTGAPTKPKPTPTGTPTPAPGANGEPKAPAHKPAFAATVHAAGAALARRKLAHRAHVSLPFAFPEPGKVQLRIVAHGRTIAVGSRTAAGTAKVTLKLSAAGRRLLQRSPHLKVTLKAVFTPSRAGAAPQRASTKVTLTGSSSRA